MFCQSGHILDVAKTICSRSNRVLGFVSQNRVHLLMQSLCRTANTCKPGLVVGALRIACNCLCTAGCPVSLSRRQPCVALRVPQRTRLLAALQFLSFFCSTTSILSGLAPLKVLFEVVVRSDTLCFLVSDIGCIR